MQNHFLCWNKIQGYTHVRIRPCPHSCGFVFEALKSQRSDPLNYSGYLVIRALFATDSSRIRADHLPLMSFFRSTVLWPVSECSQGDCP